MNSYKNNFKDYFCEINKTYPIEKQTIISIVVSLIVFILDCLNIPSRLMEKYAIPLFVAWVLLASVIIILLLLALEKDFHKMLKNPSINFIDITIYITICSVLFYAIFNSFTKNWPMYKIIILTLLQITFSSLACYRVYKYHTFKKTMDKKEEQIKSEYNIVDLKDLITIGNENTEINKIKNNWNGKPIFLEDKAVEYDLLERDFTINHLFNIITSTNSKDKFVISLEGQWGSGKTTILNNTKKKIITYNENTKDKEIVIIDKFNPWIYKDEKALLLNMLNCIMEKSGLKYNNILAYNAVDSLLELIFGKDRKSLIKSLFFKNDVKVNNDIKDKINICLRSSEKKFVFFIDNIERAEKENIILLFKLVASVLDFENIIYVLSFDSDQLKKIFEDLNIDYRYLNKIIDLQIHLPENDTSVLKNIYTVALKNILILLDESEDSLSDYESFINFICEAKLDVRDFKRFINSAVNLDFKTKYFLYKRDLLIIEYIKLFNFELYVDIYKNKHLFISHNMQDSWGEHIDGEKREEINALFKKEENKKYQSLLLVIFPSMSEYYEALSFSQTDKQERLICSEKYFDLYFIGTRNINLKIEEQVEGFVRVINKKELPFEFKNQCFDQIMSDLLHREGFFRILQIYLNDVDDDSVFDFIKMFFCNVVKIKNSPYEYSAMIDLFAGIISSLLERLSDEELFNKFLEHIKQSYEHLYFLQRICGYFCRKKETKDIRKNGLEKVIKEMEMSILKGNINLFEENTYMYKNILCLYYENDSEEFNEKRAKARKYINKDLNVNTIYRFLNDMTVDRKGEFWIEHYINPNHFEYFIEEDKKAKIGELLKTSEPKTDAEKLAFDVYKFYIQMGPSSSIRINDPDGQLGVRTELPPLTQIETGILFLDFDNILLDVDKKV